MGTSVTVSCTKGRYSVKGTRTGSCGINSEFVWETDDQTEPACTRIGEIKWDNSTNDRVTL